MTLELVPIEGARIITEEERQRLLRRIRPISKEELAQFDDTARREIKLFLIGFLITSEMIHHEMERVGSLDHEERLGRLHVERIALFESATPGVKGFAQLMDFCPMEPWQEMEILIRGLRGEDLRRYYEIKHKSGVKAATNNPFLMQMDENSGEEMMSLALKSRITRREVESLIFRYSIEEIVKNIILARKCNTGQFWSSDHYDL